MAIIDCGCAICAGSRFRFYTSSALQSASRWVAEIRELVAMVPPAPPRSESAEASLRRAAQLVPRIPVVSQLGCWVRARLKQPPVRFAFYQGAF